MISQVRHLLLMPPNWLGDVVMAQPAMRSLAHYYAQAEVFMYGRRWLKDLVPYLDLGEISVRSEAVPKADAVFLFPNSFRSAWQAWQSGTKERIGYRGQWRRWLLSRPLPRRLDLLHEHHRLYYLDMLRQLDIPVLHEDVRLKAPANDLSAVQKILAEYGMDIARLICVAPGAQFGGAKRYPADAYASVLRKLAACGWHLLILGTQAEYAIGQQVLAGVHGVFRNVCGRTSLRQALQLVSQCRLMLCNDSGLMHVAAGLGRATVCMFGATDPVRTAPSGTQVRLLYEPAPCSPCLARECDVKGQPCMRNIRPDMVFHACLEALES